MIKKHYIEAFDYNEMVEAVSKKVGVDITDSEKVGKKFFPKSVTLREWHKQKKYPKKDSDGKDVGSSKIWWNEFQEEIKNGLEATPYLRFWHFQLDFCLSKNEVVNGCNTLLYVGPLDEKAEPWQKKIQSIFGEVCKDISKDNYVRVYINW